PRAWVSVDAKYRGETFRFFSTHLEQDVMPFAPIQEAQGNEVISLLASSPYPVIALGDYNTGDGAATATYGNLIASGLTDVWREVNFENSGFTTEGIGPDLLGAFTLSKRLDLIMYHGNMRGLQAWLVGDQEGNRTPSGLMPSDHAGVVARIRIGVR
ncbi:MAG TPA: hypothetical protein VE967_12700, partial [Gemmatimonadaceae bacterium]|nr:hypothetical protein [Gemmatimonadaceae bacterium]